MIPLPNNPPASLFLGVFCVHGSPHTPHLPPFTYHCIWRKQQSSCMAADNNIYNFKIQLWNWTYNKNSLQYIKKKFWEIPLWWWCWYYHVHYELGKKVKLSFIHHLHNFTTSEVRSSTTHSIYYLFYPDTNVVNIKLT